ncbi:MAG: polysaccharide deacetylase family protein [Oscillospiraceae bacterium]|jgi:peptidoglycan/xylan/chitin deacetylase (PgdA/CDA1 family)|nr:polysaccharide deacetylase family protein [Oscillospiraceae bacterium]
MNWQGRLKALTFSYDDGVEQDVRLIDIFNRYGMKCTFNLNSGQASPSNSWTRDGVTIRRIDSSRYPDIYQGHEPACHSLTHPRLEELPDIEIDRQLREDKSNLEHWFGVKIQGMAYPYGTYDERVISAASKNGLRYARTTISTRSFDMPADLMRLPATCHHNDPALPDLIDRFLALKPDQPALFYIWGHSYEFDIDNSWKVIEDACAALSGHDDIFYGTNAQTLLS